MDAFNNSVTNISNKLEDSQFLLVTKNEILYNGNKFIKENECWKFSHEDINSVLLKARLYNEEYVNDRLNEVDSLKHQINLLKHKVNGKLNILLSI
jgi:hypothetical protein